MSGPHPFDFAAAQKASHDASAEQRATENFLRQAFKDFAIKREAYYLALALRITEIRAGGVAVTLAKELAWGDPKVARLRRERDIAEGVKEAAAVASWRGSADRRATEQLVTWSMRAAFRDERHDPEPEYERAIGRRAA